MTISMVRKDDIPALTPYSQRPAAPIASLGCHIRHTIYWTL